MKGLPIRGTDQLWNTHRVYCVGRNYAEHAREMGADPAREPPFFFAKPADAVVPGDVPYPTMTVDFQHEVELVLALGRGGRDPSLAAADHCIEAYAVGIDWTRRDLQAEAKRLGRPWEIAKAFDHSASIGPLQRRTETGTLQSGRIWLSVNESPRQQGHLEAMIWQAPEIIAELSRYFRLAAGDLIYTGTPAGVGAVRIGDTVTAGIDGLESLSLRILPA